MGSARTKAAKRKPARRASAAATKPTRKPGARTAVKAPRRAAKKPSAPAAAKPAPSARAVTVPERPAAIGTPGRSARPSVPPPPIAVPPVPVRVVPPAPPGEMGAVRDVGRLLRHGEIFGSHRIEIRHLPTPVNAPSGRIAVADPLTPASGRVLARQVPPGKYRVMLGIAHLGAEQRVAAAVMHVGRPPIARWVVAHFENQKPPRSADQLPGYTVDSGAGAFMDALVLDDLRRQPDVPEPPPNAALVPQLLGVGNATASGEWISDPASGRNLVAFSAGWGDGVYTSYWALDGADQPVCLVTDFEVFKAADWRVPKRPKR